MAPFLVPKGIKLSIDGTSNSSAKYQVIAEINQWESARQTVDKMIIGRDVNCKRCVLILGLKILSLLEGQTTRGRECQMFSPEIEKALLPISVLVLGAFSNESAYIVE